MRYQNKMSFFGIITVFLVLLCLASTAAAFDTEYYWDPGYVGYTIDNSFPSSYQSSIHAAADAWTDAGADFDYYWSANSNNKIYYESIGSPLGTCSKYVYSGTNRLSKWIIKINSDKSWSTSDPCPDNYYDIQSTLTHELGHDVGLGHSDERWATMWPTGYDGTTWKRSLYLDDENGIIAIYGND